MLMILQEKTIRRFRRHLAVLLLLRYFLPLATGWSFVWGIAVLALRAAVGVERTPLLWGLSGVAGCLVLAAVLARRRLPAANAVRALLDEQSGCGGLLMAGAEQELGDWRQKMPAIHLPRVQWDGRRAAMLLAVAAGFVLLTFLAPRELADLASSSPLEMYREIARLIEQIALLKGESLLTPERADMLKDKLAELHEHSSGKDPARTLEALDHLRNLAGETAREAVEDHTRRRERLGEAEALAEALRQGADMLGPRLKKEGMAKLVGLLGKSGLDLRQLAERLDPELVKAVREKGLDAEQLKKLAETLHGSKIDLAGQVEKMHKAGLIDAEMLAKCHRAEENEGEGLRALLRKGNDKNSRGSVGTPLTRGKPVSADGYKFKAEVLPPGALASLKSNAVGLPGAQRGKAIHPKPEDLPSSGALHEAAAGDGSANTEILLPRHRAAVKRYFERQPSSKK
jgi:hypothetical protein